MQQRAGLLFLAKNTKRILMVLEDEKWTVPTFPRQNSLLGDAENLLSTYSKERSFLSNFISAKIEGLNTEHTYVL